MSFRKDFSEGKWLFIGILHKKGSEQLSELKRSSLIFSLPSFSRGKQLLSGCAQRGLLCRPAVPPCRWQATQVKAAIAPFIKDGPQGRMSPQGKDGTFPVGGKTISWLRPLFHFKLIWIEEETLEVVVN